MLLIIVWPFFKPDQVFFQFLSVIILLQKEDVMLIFFFNEPFWANKINSLCCFAKKFPQREEEKKIGYGILAILAL